MGRKKEPNSWRSKGKGDCFTTKGGAVVCEGSKGMNYKPKGRKKSTATGTRIQTSAGAKKNLKVGKFKIVGTKTIDSKKTKGKKVKMIEVQALGKDASKKTRLINQSVYQSKFVRI